MKLSLVSPELGATLIDAVDHPSFGAILLQAVKDFALIDEVFAFYADHDAAPVVMASSSDMADANERADVFSKRFYRFDPAAYDRAVTPVGSGVASTVQASQIDVREYRAICFDKPAIITKYSFGWNAPDAWYVINFYAREKNADAALGHLSQLAILALSAMVRARHKAQKPVPAPTDLEARLAQRLPDMPPREREVCARTFMGMTAAVIASDLGISKNSVLTYRQRTYRRYGIASANALLLQLLA
jgi:DNA-binding CsgD family transcriptional regulator